MSWCRASPPGEYGKVFEEEYWTVLNDYLTNLFDFIGKIAEGVLSKKAIQNYVVTDGLAERSVEKRLRKTAAWFSHSDADGGL